MEKKKALNIITQLAKVAAKGKNLKLKGGIPVDGKNYTEAINYDHIYLDGRITRAYDGNNWLTAELTCEVSTPIAVDAVMLKNAITAMKNDITLTLDGSHLLVNGVVKVRAYALDPEDFRHPLFVRTYFDLPSNFNAAYKEVIAHVSKDPLRPAMTRAFLNGGLKELVATDARTLVRYRLDGYGGPDFYVPVLPTDLVGSLCIGKSEESEVIDKDRSVDTFYTYEMKGDVFTYSYRIATDTRYPLYLSVWPESFSEDAELSSDELLDELAKCKLTKAPFGIFTFSDDSLSVLAANYNTEYKGNIPSLHDGLGIEIGFFFDQLERCLKPFKGQTIVIEMSQPKRAAIIRSKARPEIATLIMPVVIN